MKGLSIKTDTTDDGMFTEILINASERTVFEIIKVVTEMMANEKTGGGMSA